MKKVTTSDSRAFGESCRHEFKKVSFASAGIIPSQSCTCAKYSMVWRLATFFLTMYCKATTSQSFINKMQESYKLRMYRVKKGYLQEKAKKG